MRTVCTAAADCASDRGIHTASTQALKGGYLHAWRQHVKQQTAEADDPAAHSSPVWQQVQQTSGARICCERPGRARGKCKTKSTKKNDQPHRAKRQKTFCMLTSRKDSSTTVHPTSAGRGSDTTGSPSLRHASCPTQAKGWWSRTSSVRLGLCRMQATRWHAAATGTLL